LDILRVSQAMVRIKNVSFSNVDKSSGDSPEPELHSQKSSLEQFQKAHGEQGPALSKRKTQHRVPGGDDGDKCNQTLDDDELPDEHPLWCVNEQIKGLLEGCGASEDHENVMLFLRGIGLPDGTVKRIHKALVCGEVILPNTQIV